MYINMFEAYISKKDLNVNNIYKVLKDTLNRYSITSVFFNKESNWEYTLSIHIERNDIYIDKHLQYVMGNLTYMNSDNLTKFLKLYNKKYIEQEKLFKEERKFYYDLKLKHKKIDKDVNIDYTENIKKLIDLIKSVDTDLKSINKIKTTEYFIVPNERFNTHSIEIFIETKK